MDRSIWISLAAGPVDAADASPAAASNLLAIMLMIVGAIMLGVILTGSVRRKIARTQSERPSARERIDAVKRTARGSEDLQAASAGMLDTARRLSAQLDAKGRWLERLIADADERIAALQAADPPSDTATTPAIPSPEDAAPPPPPPPPPDQDRSIESPGDPIAAAVYELADEGEAPVEIARRLDEQVGKVELILALRQT